VLLLLVLAVIVALSTSQGAEAEDSRPNVVVLMTDDQTVADMAAMSETQRLLGDRGVTFRRSYVSYPVCCPSRATLFSGQYAHSHRVMGLYPPTGGYGRFDKQESLPVWMERAGYTTAHVGKYMNGYGSDVLDDVPPGWTEWYGAVDGTTYRMWDFTLNENGERRTYGDATQAPADYQTDVYRDKAVDFIERRSRRDAPFFLSVSFLAPHHEGPAVRARAGRLVRPAPRHDGAFAGEPLPLPRGFDEADVSDKPPSVRRLPRLGAAEAARIQARYEDRLESLLAVDEAVAEIVAALERSGKLDETYILFTSDNGYMQGEHRVPSGKMLPYEPSTRVPLLLRGPGLPQGAASRALVANVDLAPTILDLAGAQPGKLLDGRSLMPLARRPGLRTRRPILHETGGQRYLPLSELDAGALPSTREVMSYQAVRTERYLYVRYRSGVRELYDMKRDPAQLESRHRDMRYRAIQKRLDGMLRRLIRCRGGACRRVAGALPEPATRPVCRAASCSPSPRAAR
jgi:N-acetylglucosamine-6-sulfatase